MRIVRLLSRVAALVLPVAMILGVMAVPASAEDSGAPSSDHIQADAQALFEEIAVLLTQLPSTPTALDAGLGPVIASDASPAAVAAQVRELKSLRAPAGSGPVGGSFDNLVTSPAFVRVIDYLADGIESGRISIPVGCGFLCKIGRYLSSPPDLGQALQIVGTAVATVGGVIACAASVVCGALVVIGGTLVIAGQVISFSGATATYGSEMANDFRYTCGLYYHYDPVGGLSVGPGPDCHV